MRVCKLMKRDKIRLWFRYCTSTMVDKSENLSYLWRRVTCKKCLAKREKYPSPVQKPRDRRRASLCTL